MVSCTYLGAASVVLSDLQKFAIEENSLPVNVSRPRARCVGCVRWFLVGVVSADFFQNRH